MKKKVWLLVSLVFIILGVACLGYGLTAPFPLKDMNGDGVIDWHDYDVNRDGAVDMRDYNAVILAYGSSVGDGKYNLRCDFNGDGYINDYDMNAIRQYFVPLDIGSVFAFRLQSSFAFYLQFGVGLIVAGAVLLVFTLIKGKFGKAKRSGKKD